MTPQRTDFEAALAESVAQARRDGRAHLDVNAGVLHREVGGYPGRDHRMPMVCEILRANMRGDDAVVATPRKGNGAGLTIRYRITR